MISEAIACVGRLKGLWISDNCLKSLPLALAKVKTLEVLDVEESEECFFLTLFLSFVMIFVPFVHFK